MPGAILKRSSLSPFARGCAGDCDCESVVRINARVIQVRPSQNPSSKKQGGWEVFEAKGVCPVYLDEHARDSALSYAWQRAGYGRAEIEVLDEAWNVVETISSEDSRPLV